MAVLYRVESVYGTEYCRTKREAEAARPGGEQPDEVSPVDAKGECVRLHALAESLDAALARARLILRDLVDVTADAVLRDTHAGRAAEKYVRDNPPPAATSPG